MGMQMSWRVPRYINTYTTAFELQWLFIKSIFHTGFPTTDFLNVNSNISPLEQQYFLQFLQQSKYF